MEAGLRLMGHGFTIRTRCERALALLNQNFSALWCEPIDKPFANYEIVPAGEGWQVIGGEQERAADTADLIHLLERRLVLDLQSARPDLLFIHAAVLGHSRGAVLLVAPSGTGKSTTALALVERGLRYLSDELAAVDLESGVVHPYPHALCLKETLPTGYQQKGFDTEATAHIRAEHLNLLNAPLPLSELIFLQRGEREGPLLESLSQAQAVAYMFPEILNGLAHPAFGLDAALRMTAQCPAHVLRLGATDESAEMIVAALMHQGVAA